MKWENKPTKDGFYWAKLKGTNYKIMVVYVNGYNRRDEKYGCMVSYMGTDWDDDMNENNCNGKWYGPIPQPKEDK